MRKSLLMALIVSSSSLLSASLYSPEALGKLKVISDHRGFSVLKDGETHPVEKENLDRTLSSLNAEQRMKFLEKGHMKVNIDDRNQYQLASSGSIKGGRAILGWLAWAAVMAPGLVVIAIVKKADRSGTAPTKEMFEHLQSVANVAKSFGDTVPGPL